MHCFPLCHRLFIVGVVAQALVFAVEHRYYGLSNPGKVRPCRRAAVFNRLRSLFPLQEYVKITCAALYGFPEIQQREVGVFCRTGTFPCKNIARSPVLPCIGLQQIDNEKEGVFCRKGTQRIEVFCRIPSDPCSVKDACVQVVMFRIHRRDTAPRFSFIGLTGPETIASKIQ